VTFHIINPVGPDEKTMKTFIYVSMAIKCFNDLVQYGVKEVLEREYKDSSPLQKEDTISPLKLICRLSLNLKVNIYWI
jgi:Arp2/3 complex, 34 kD subunit p34-Arc